MTFPTHPRAFQAATDTALARAETFLSDLVGASTVNVGALPFNVTRLLPDYRPSYAAPIEPDIDAVPLNESARPDVPGLSMPIPPDSPGLDIFNFATLPEIVIPPNDIPVFSVASFN